MSVRNDAKRAEIVAETAVSFARRVLKRQTARIERMLRLAVKHGDDQPDHVHQLRVATRRAIATLETLDALVPRRRGKKLRRTLRKIRRAAGAARDADVLLPHLVARGERLSKELIVTLLQRLSRERAQAHYAVRRAFPKQWRRRWRTMVRRCLKRLRWSGHADNQPTAAQLLERASYDSRRALKRFSRRGRANARTLHALRLQCKRLRYVLELQRLAAPSEKISRQLGDVKVAQEKLGQINDYVSANQTLRDWLADWSITETAEEVRGFVRREEAAADELIAAFREWWVDHDLSRAARPRADAAGIEPDAGRVGHELFDNPLL